MTTESSPETGERDTIDPPRIYVASLSDYNAGQLHGAWIDAAVEVDALHDAVQAMLATSAEPNAEEWAIHDYDGFGPLHLDEYESLTTISRIARAVVEHGPAIAAWLSTQGTTDDETLAQFDEAYLGEWPSIEAYADELLDNFDLERRLDEAVPEWTRPYVKVDSAGLARDLELGGDIGASETPSGAFYIFDLRVGSGQ